MRIVLDLQACQCGSRFRGIGRYSMALAQAMARRASNHELWLALNARLHETTASIRAAFDGLIPGERITSFEIPGPAAEKEPVNTWRTRAAELVREHFIAGLQPDILHIASLFEGFGDDAVSSVGTLATEIKHAVTSYDLIPLLNADTYLINERTREWYYRKLNELKKAGLLLAISENSRREAIYALGLPENRVVNIYASVDDRFRRIEMNADQKNALRRQYGAQRDIVLYAPGGFDQRKNFENLISAYALLPAAIRSSHQLMIASKLDDVKRVRLQTMARKAGLASDELILTDYVPDDDLVALYNLCELFVFPSFHEGFGLPVLEAIACGAPTIGSNRTSVPEVIGWEEALFDPFKPQSIADKMVQGLQDENFRRSLCEHGVQQARKFSWDESARRALEAFEEWHDRSRSDRTDWAGLQAKRKTLYRNLIDALADIPCTPVAPLEADLKATARSISENDSVTDTVARACKLGESITWRIEGPFDSSYSLAIVNREAARALSALGHQVVLHSTEGPGDFEPAADFLGSNPDLARMHAMSGQFPPERAEVVSRNLYPPRVQDMNCRMNLLHHYAWEESGFPWEWVDAFNEHLQGITCQSKHVEKILIDHGVTVPLFACGSGVDHWERIEPDPDFEVKARAFRFLHVSSCFPRKGAEILLDAFGRAFTDKDDVSLVIKTFPNPHNEIHGWLAERRKKNPDYPHVIIFEEDSSDSVLKALYQQCHALVAPSRAEGFGLPMAEAMLSGLPVIATAWGGQLEFCNEETAWLVDYKFDRARTHFELFDSVWTEPDVEDLARALREVYSLPAIQRNERSSRGRELLLGHYRWTSAAERTVETARKWAESTRLPKPRIGWITTWNTRCGIATYSRHLIENMPAPVTVLASHAGALTQADDSNVIRCWHLEYANREEGLEVLGQTIEDHGIDTILIQFNYTLFNLDKLAGFIEKQIDAGRIVIMALHSTFDPAHVLPHKRLAVLREALKRCQRILVHSLTDLNRLKEMRLVENVALFPHGIIDHVPSTPMKPGLSAHRIIASYGFFLPHKGLPELVEAVALMRQAGEDVGLVMVNAEYPEPVSEETIKDVRARIRRLGIEEHVRMITDYLPDRVSLSHLSQADLVVFPYQDTGESASGAVRYGLASERPVAVTPLDIFEDVRPAVFQLPGFSPQELADGIREALSHLERNSEYAQGLASVSCRWREAHRYSRLGGRLYGMLQALARKTKP